MDDNTINTQAKNLTKAIFQHESGMNFDAKGDNGTSTGAGQWQQSTWKAQAKDVLGDENAPMTKENQSVVAQGTIRKLIKQGKNAAQIAAIWNSGSDKNWENKVGSKTYPDGTVIKYNVPKYVKEVTDLYHSYKGQSQEQIQGQVQPEQPQKEGFLKSLAKSFIEPVATTIARPIQAGAELLGASAEDVNNATKNIAGDFVAPVPQSDNDVLKDVGRAAQTVALGTPVSSIPKAIGTGVLAGAGSGLEQSGNLSGAALGGAIGGATGLVGGTISKAFDKLPTGLTKGAFNLDEKQAQKMLAEKSVGTTQGLINQSEKSLSKSGKTVQNLLQKADETGVRGSGNDAVRQTLLNYPEYVGGQKIVNKNGIDITSEGLKSFADDLKDLIPSKGGLQGVSRREVVDAIDKVIDGTANFQEKNLVKSALYNVSSKNYENLALRGTKPAFSKGLAMDLAENLSKEIKGWIPETQAPFKELATESGIKKALVKSGKKTEPLVGYKDFIPFATGESIGGIPGAITATAGRKIIGSPATRFALAKGIQGIGKVAKPISSRAGLVTIAAPK